MKLGPAVSYCVCLMNRAEHFKEMVRGLCAMPDKDWELVVTDFGSTDAPFEEMPKDDERYFVVPLQLPFTRARGLNAAAKEAQGDILCFLDADIVVPPDYQQRVLRHAQRGQVYWPICYQLHSGAPRTIVGDRAQYSVGQHHGQWCEAGYGLSAWHRDDWHRDGGYDEAIVRWGSEDDTLWAKAQAAGLRSVRRKVPDLFHLWHERTMAFREKYHDYPGKTS